MIRTRRNLVDLNDQEDHYETRVKEDDDRRVESQSPVHSKVVSLERNW